MVSNTKLMRIFNRAQRKSHHGFVLVAVTIVLETHWAYYHGENATYPLASDTYRGRCSFPTLMPTDPSNSFGDTRQTVLSWEGFRGVLTLECGFSSLGTEPFLAWVCQGL